MALRVTIKSWLMLLLLWERLRVEERGGDVITLVVVVSRHQGTKEKKGDLSSFCINPG